jgi:hypothetical protein
MTQREIKKMNVVVLMKHPPAHHKNEEKNDLLASFDFSSTTTFNSQF